MFCLGPARAHGPGPGRAGPRQHMIFQFMTSTKRTRSARTIRLPAVSRRDLCYASENEGFRFLLWIHYSLLFATIRNYSTLFATIRHYSTLFATIRHHYTQLYATIWLSDEVK